MSLDDPGFESAAEKLILTTETDPWGMTLLPSKSVRLEALRRVSSVLGIDDQSFTMPRPRTDDELRHMGTVFQRIDSNPAINAKKLAGPVKATIAELAACAQMTVPGVPTCVWSLKTIQDLMAPKSSAAGFMTSIDDWKAILLSRQYEEGLRTTAQRMQVAIAKEQFAPVENIFDLLIDSFQKSKMELPQAKDAAFKVMGLLANGGANTFDRIRSMEGANISPSPPMSQLGQALGFISNAMHVLDSMKQEKGYPLFSLPKDVRAACDNAKPYHFWLSAALARKLVVEERFNPKTAATSTFIAAKGYQVIRGHFFKRGVSNLGIILAQEAFSPIANIVRTDLAYSASGAHYGAAFASGKRPNIDLDESLRELIRQAPTESPLSRSDAEMLVERHKFEALRHWDSKFKPNAAFEYLKTNNPL
ncbi:MAG: hypothetical protein JNJ49_10930 [Bdellovibrionaceae bacterium]|nr:hypothetical protein [Pseudobdellovibrionaceae bacterium]